MLSGARRSCAIPDRRATLYLAEESHYAAWFKRRFHSQKGEGKPTFDAELLVDFVQVKFDRAFSNIQFARNRFVCEPFGGEKHYLAFARAQRIAVQGVARFILRDCKSCVFFHGSEFRRTSYRDNCLLMSTLMRRRLAH